MMLSLRSFFRDTNTYTTDAEHSTPSPSTHTLSPIENIFKRRLRVKIECPKPDISLVPPIPLFHVIAIFKWRDVSPFWINNSMNGHWVVLISEPPSHPNDIQCSQLCHFETHFIYTSLFHHMCDTTFSPFLSHPLSKANFPAHQMNTATPFDCAL